MNCDHPATDVYGRCTYCCEMLPTGDLELMFDLVDCTALRQWAAGLPCPPKRELGFFYWHEFRALDRPRTNYHGATVEQSRDMLFLQLVDRTLTGRHLRHALRTLSEDWPGYVPSDVPPDAGPLSARF